MYSGYHSRLTQAHTSLQVCWTLPCVVVVQQIVLITRLYFMQALSFMVVARFVSLSLRTTRAAHMLNLGQTLLYPERTFSPVKELAA